MTTVPCSPYRKTGGIFYFARMLEKIRLNDAGSLREDLRTNLGVAFDQRCVDFLGVTYAETEGKVREGADDAAVLEWAFATGYQPTDEEIEVWNSYMRKVGWNDGASGRLVGRKADSGLSERDDIQTMFDYIDADEGRETVDPECY